LGGTQISIRDSIVVAQAKTVGPREAAEEISRQLASLDLAMIIVPFLARGVDLEAVFGWRVVAAIAGVGEDAPETDADLPLQVGDDGGQRVAVVRVAGQGLDVGDELAENSGITWDEATFREYIKDPKAKVPGTKMIFPGLKDDKRIDDLIAYLKQFDASGKKSAARTPPRPMRAAAAMRDQREDETDEAAANTAQETFRRTR
jgi:hypothetical protein